MLLCACERGPDAQSLKSRYRRHSMSNSSKAYLKWFHSSVPVVRHSRIRASADDKLTVYYNARIRFLQDYNLTTWDSLNFATLSYLLGATEKGIEGVLVVAIKKMTSLKVFGTSTYALRSGQWRPVASRAQVRQVGQSDRQDQTIA